MTHILGVQGPAVNIPAGTLRPTGGVALDNDNDGWLFSNTATLLTPGSNSQIFVEALSAPSWYDGSGRILTPGIYAAGFQVNPPNTGTGYLTLQSPLDGYFAYPIAGLVALSEQWVAMGFPASTHVFIQPDVVAIGTPDLGVIGWNATFDFFLTSDAPSLSVTPYLKRLAYPA